MPTKTYYSVAGEIIAEETGGVRTDYITDALGSIVGTVDSSQAVVNTYRYKPYGSLLAKTGTGPDPRLLWTGTTGSRTTNLNRADQYNQARHLGVKEGSWTTTDPLWPEELAYGYVKGNPTNRIDPDGLIAVVGVKHPDWAAWGCTSSGKNGSAIRWSEVENRPGYIVQFITNSIRAVRCRSSDPPIAESKSFFEAWEVKRGLNGYPEIYLNKQRLPAFGPHDTWEGGRLQDYRASAKISGTVVQIAGTPDGFNVFRPEGVSIAADLLSTYTWKEWTKYSGKAKLLQKSLMVSDCCKRGTRGVLTRTPTFKTDNTTMDCR